VAMIHIPDHDSDPLPRAESERIASASPILSP
jgi:hypothetical protein